MTTFEERFYSSPNGWFRREGMICAPVHVLADSRECALEASGVCSNGEARESTYKNRAISGGSVGSDNCRSSDSRGGRTIICGGSVESGHTGMLELPDEASQSAPRCTIGAATGLNSERQDSRGSDRPATISGKVGRW